MDRKKRELKGQRREQCFRSVGIGEWRERERKKLSTIGSYRREMSEEKNRGWGLYVLR
jgi:hypothetical protein